MDLLPPEIIDQIFAECLPLTTFPPPPLHPEHAPLLLMHVCSSWRQFALNCSSLWSSFSIEHHHLNIGQSDLDEQTFWSRFLKVQSQMLEQIALWHSANKGSQVALSMALQYPISRPRVDPPTWEKHIQAAVLHHIHIIRKLKLSIPHEDAQLLCKVLPSDIHALECLDIQLDSNLDAARVVSNALKAPTLRRLQLFPDIPISQSFSCSHLTHLSLLGKFPGTAFRPILQNFPQLERLSMTVDEDMPTAEGSVLITSHHLTALSLTFQECSNPSFFQDLYFPALNYLHISSSVGLGNYLFTWDSGGAIHYRHFVNQLRHLQTLILGYHQIKGDALLDLLRSTPEVVNLVVDSCMVTYRSFLAGLAYIPDEGHRLMLSKLEYFTMYIDVEDSSLDQSFKEEVPGLGEALLQMVHSRTHPLNTGDFSFPDNRPARLRKVSLYHDGDSSLTNVIKSPLQVSEELDGLDLVILESRDKENWGAEEPWFW